MTTTAECQHTWQAEYYGVRCIKCDLFYPDNCAPWDYVDNEDEDEDICMICGGKLDDAWSPCFCDMLELEDEEEHERAH